MRLILALTLIVAVLLIGVWDVAAAYRHAPDETVSQTIYDWSGNFPILPLVVGIIMGHVFWPVSKPTPSEPSRMIGGQ